MTSPPEVVELEASPIRDLIKRAVEKTETLDLDVEPELRSTFGPVVPSDEGIPTLVSGMYRPLSAMLIERYAAFGRWTLATHGHWLGLDDMAALWGEPEEELLVRVKRSRQAGEDNWPNEASALFRPDRLALFACSDVNNETIYLLWLEFEDEPELWVYDSNGESRYRDLSTYLQAYLEDDLSASERSWCVDAPA